MEATRPRDASEVEAPPSLANQASGVIGTAADTPPPLDPWADEDGHQLRTRAVRCRRCVRRETWNYDAVCCGCRS